MQRGHIHRKRAKFSNAALGVSRAIDGQYHRSDRVYMARCGVQWVFPFFVSDLVPRTRPETPESTVFLARSSSAGQPAGSVGKCEQ